jgi:hypothetical protein
MKSQALAMNLSLLVRIDRTALQRVDRTVQRGLPGPDRGVAAIAVRVQGAVQRSVRPIVEVAIAEVTIVEVTTVPVATVGGVVDGDLVHRGRFDVGSRVVESEVQQVRVGHRLIGECRSDRVVGSVRYAVVIGVVVAVDPGRGVEHARFATCSYRL